MVGRDAGRRGDRVPRRQQARSPGKAAWGRSGWDPVPRREGKEGRSLSRPRTRGGSFRASDEAAGGSWRDGSRTAPRVGSPPASILQPPRSPFEVPAPPGGRSVRGSMTDFPGWGVLKSEKRVLKHWVLPPDPLHFTFPSVLSMIRRLEPGL